MVHSNVGQGNVGQGNAGQGGVGQGRVGQGGVGTLGIDQHPDIAELRARYDRAAENPAAHLTEGALLLAGVYLAASPWIVGFTPFEGDLTVCNFIVGLAVAALAFGYAAAFARTHGIAWVAVVLGVWTMVAPGVVQGTAVTAGAVASNIVTGLIITVLGLATMFLGQRREGGGDTARVRR